MTTHQKIRLTLKATIAAATLIASTGCVSNEKYDELKSERDALALKVKNLEDQGSTEATKNQIISIIQSLHNNTFEPTSDAEKLNKLLTPEARKSIDKALQSKADTAITILTTYKKLIDENTQEIKQQLIKTSEIEKEIKARQAEINNILKYLNTQEFSRQSLIIRRKFDVDEKGNSYYEASRIDDRVRVVVVTPPNEKPPQGIIFTTFVKVLGDRKTVFTNSNAFRSFETQEYVDYVELATKDELLALTNGGSELPALQSKLNSTKNSIEQLKQEIKQKIAFSLLSINQIIENFNQNNLCSKNERNDPTNTALTNYITKEESSKENQDTPTEIPPTTTESNSLDHGLTASMVEKCKTDLKAFIIKDSDRYTDENEKAVRNNCTRETKKFLCFLEKTKSSDFVSIAEKKTFMAQCGIE